ncbi:MAG TPA: DUF6263 family protein [Planctomicrobium sp.]|nr:DUF6263 family protein [Planctomicrobium sp.]
MRFETIYRCLTLTGFFLASFGIGDSLATADDGIQLRYRFEEGQIVRYRVVLNDDYRIHVGETTEEPYSHQSSTKSYRVKSVNPDGSAVLELKIEEIQLEILQNGEKLSFDSRSAKDKDRPPVFLALEGLIGEPHLQLTISPRGEISDYKPLVAKDQVPNDPASAAFDVLVALPEKAVTVGESWKEDFTANIMIPPGLKKPVRMQRTYMLKSYEQNRAEIEIKTRVLTVLDDAEEEMQLLRRRPHGTVIIDTARGLLVSKKLSQDNEVTGFNMGASVIRFQQKQDEVLVETKSAEK